MLTQDIVERASAFAERTVAYTGVPNVVRLLPHAALPHALVQVCDHALACAIAMDDLAFALRMCQYMDDEGFWCDRHVRHALCHAVVDAINKLPETAAVTSEGDAVAATEWKVEGTNATVEEIRALDALIHVWLDTELDEIEEIDPENPEVSDDEEGEIIFEVHDDKSDEVRTVRSCKGDAGLEGGYSRGQSALRSGSENKDRRVNELFLGIL